MTTSDVFSILTIHNLPDRVSEQCLASVQSQNHSPVKHCIISSEHISRKEAEDDIHTSEYIGFLNAATVYDSPEVLSRVAARFQEPDQPEIIYIGTATSREEICRLLQQDPKKVESRIFVKQSALKRAGGIDPLFSDAMDYELILRLMLGDHSLGILDINDIQTASNNELLSSHHCQAAKKHFGYVHWRIIRSHAQHCILKTPDRGNDVLLSTNRKIAELHLDYNFDWPTRHSLSEKNASRHAQETLADMLNHGLAPNLHAIEGREVSILEDRKSREARSSRVFSGKSHLKKGRLLGYEFAPTHSWFFEKHFYKAELKKSRKFISAHKKKRSKDTCIIVGNGPSLNKTPRDEIRNADVFISNFAYYDPELLNKATFLTIVNDLVMRQAAFDLPSLKSVTQIFPIWLAPLTSPRENVFYLNATLRREFSSNVSDWVSWRSTVSFFNLQLAISLGYKKICLIGFDNNYVQAPEAREGDVIDQTEDDNNHFLAHYFKGKKWQAADTGQMARVYELARDAAAEHGVDIVNCTDGGKLEIFRRSPLSKEI